MDNLVSLVIKGISYSQTQTGAYALILEEESGTRKLPIIIGSFEAQSIALALEKDLSSPRPLTHDLFLSLGSEFNISVEFVYIYKLEDGVFYSNIVFVDGNGKRSEIDSRTSDAIALAVRFDAPIFAYEEVVEKAGIQLDIIEEEDGDEFDQIEEDFFEEEVIIEEESNFIGWSKEELEDAMKQAVMNEDYELAARLRDQIENFNN
jgi:uncharacterized protein